MNKVAVLLVSIVISQAVGILSSFLSVSQGDTYRKLKKPFFTPPAWIFGPVWILLYTMMGVAAYRIYNVGFDEPLVKFALAWYGVQLLFNFWWSPLFFRWQLRGWAFLEIILLLTFISITAFHFFVLDSIAGYLLIPYLLWVSFAVVLNGALWVLNK